MQVTFPETQVLAVYGAPSKELDLLIRQWLNENEERHAIVLEDDERALLGLKGHERLRHCYALNAEGLKAVAWELVFLSVAFLEVPGNESKERGEMLSIYQRLSFALDGVHLVASDFIHQGVDRLSNFFKNAKRATEMRDGRKLFGKFQGMPAIICGAGPSLEEDLDFLRGAEGKALIFAGGTAISALAKFGITPHFSGMLDPHPPSKRYARGKKVDAPMFFQMRSHPDRLGKELLWLPGNDQDLFEEESFDGGWNSVTFLTRVSLELGCNPIILVGVDLAQKEGNPYAGGFDRPEGGDLIPTDQEGLFTRRDWLTAANWLEDAADAAKEIEWINRSKGLKIKGFVSGGEDLSERPELSSQIKTALAEIERGITLSIAPSEIEESLGKVRELVTKILSRLEGLFPNSPNLDGEYALLKREIENSLAYEKFFSPVWNVWQYPVARQIPKGVPEGYGLEVHKWLLIRGICDARGV